MTNELQPSFDVQVDLDGDDDAQIQTENARYNLDLALAKMKDDGLIRDYTLKVRA